MSDDGLRAAAVAIERLEKAWLPIEVLPHSEFFGYVPFDTARFIDALELAQRHTDGRRFCDVGCGIGTKLVLAWELGFEVAGIECREQYAAVAKWLCPDAVIELADARAFWDYVRFDVIFFYRPLVSPEGQYALERTISEQARDDALIVAEAGDLHLLGWTPVEDGACVWRRR